MTNRSPTSITLNFQQIGITKFDLDYSQTNNCGLSLAGHACCTISVTFQPTKIGTLNANVILTDNGGGSRKKSRSPERVTNSGLAQFGVVGHDFGPAAR